MRPQIPVLEPKNDLWKWSSLADSLKRCRSVSMSWFPLTRHTLKHTQAMIFPGTPRHRCQEHDTLWHFTFPNTSRSDLRFAECRGIPRYRKFHEIAHFTQCWFLYFFSISSSLGLCTGWGRCFVWWARQFTLTVPQYPLRCISRYWQI